MKKETNVVEECIKKLEELFEKYGMKCVEDKSKVGQSVIRFVSKKKETKDDNQEILKRNNMYFLVAITIKHLKYGYKMSTIKDLSYLYKNEGFKCKYEGSGCPWQFIDIENKEYCGGKPGVGYGRVIGNHAITVSEFGIIYNIFKNHEVEPIFKKEYEFKKPLYYCIKHDDITDVDIYLDKEGFSSHLMSKSCTIENKYNEWNNYRFISIENKEFEPVLPGYIKHFRVIGLKVITFLEFIIIYEIFKKYEGRDLFIMEDGYDFRENR